MEDGETISFESEMVRAGRRGTERPFSLGERRMKRTKVRPLKAEIVAFKVEEVLAQAMDELARRQFRTRSDIIRQGVIKELQAHGIRAGTA